VEYAFATACSEQAIVSWNCTYCVNSTVGTEVLHYDYVKSVDHAMYIAIHQQNKEIIVSFDGTKPSSLMNWIEDLSFNAANVSLPNYPNVSLHSGFWKVYEAHHDFLVSAMKNVTHDYPDFQIYTVGHSLGGAVATIATLDLTLNEGLQGIRTITFGCPRLGKEDFVSTWQALGLNQFRVVHAHDVVPHVIFQSWGYRHVPQEIWEKDINTYVQCDPLIGEDKNCSDSTIDINPFDHLVYLGLTSGCRASS